ncbi:MAG: ATPase [Chloroflexi bacterium]|nr:MAG: ATPase [Chloroflexota bacterium]
MARESRRSASLAQPTDINALIDRLTELATDGRRFPIGGRIMIDEQDFFDTLDQIRLALPTEIQQARRVVQDRQKVILEAQAEAERIVSVAREKANYMMSDRGLMAEAKARGDDHIRQSREQMRRSMSEFEAYALKVLERLETTLRTELDDIEQVKELIRQPRARLDP